MYKRNNKFKVAFYDTKKYDVDSFSRIKNIDIDFTFIDSKIDDHTVLLAKKHNAVCIFVHDNLTESIIRTLSNYGIRLVLLRCAGYNNVNLSAIRKYKMSLYRVPSYSPYAVAEHAFALLNTINRRIHKAYIRTREYNFSLNNLVGMDLYNKTIGIIGTGKIGKVMIDIAKGYHMNVLAYDLNPDKSLDIPYVSLETLYKSSDIISLHCPLTSDNYHMINSKSIRKMKDGVIIINTSRGGLVNSFDLYKGIISRKIGAVCLDVYEEEGDIFYEDKSNHIMNNQTLALLIGLPNVIVTSHQGFLTKEALHNIAETILQNILDYIDKRKSNNIVVS